MQVNIKTKGSGGGAGADNNFVKINTLLGGSNRMMHSNQHYTLRNMMLLEDEEILFSNQVSILSA